MVKEVTILGRGPSRVLPLPSSGEIWGLNGAYKYCNRLDLLFMIDAVKYHPAETEEAERLCIPVMTFDDFPLDEIIKDLGLPPKNSKRLHYFFQSTTCYMLAYAIYKGFEKMHILGVDYLWEDEEHLPAKPSVETWVGYAMGRGIDVVLNNLSHICTPRPNRNCMYGSEQTKTKEFNLI